MRTVEFKWNVGLVKAEMWSIYHRTGGTSSYSYIIDPGCCHVRLFFTGGPHQIPTGVVKEVRENSRGFYVIVDFDE